MEKIDLKEGDKAPVFKLESFNAGTINLAEIVGDQKIVLIFSRYFGCPICQLDLKTLLEHKNAIIEKGAKILYITQSGEKVANEFIKKENIDFPVIQSSKDELYAQYGLGLMTSEAVKQIPNKIKEIRKYGIVHGEYEGWEKQGPGSFVIDTQGKIIHKQKGWLDIESILAVL
ncbi:MAG: peroxiredoxin-like family protein [Candidatus Odinarchaeota archaeon]